MDIIMISGKQGSGKTTTREKIVNALENKPIAIPVKYLKLADPIYGALRVFKNFVYEYYASYGTKGYDKSIFVDDLYVVFYDYMKDNYPNAFKLCKDIKPYYVLANWTINLYGDKDLGRMNASDCNELVSTITDKDGKFLQYFGTEFGRNNFSEDIWVICLKERISKIKIFNYEVVIIDDLRFKNEFDAFNEAIKIRLIASENTRKLRADKWRDTTEHQSEIDLDDYEAQNKFDLYIDTEQNDIKQVVDLILSNISLY